MPADADVSQRRHTDPPDHGEPDRRWSARLLWLAAAVAAALAAGAGLRAVDDDLAVDDAEHRPPVPPAELADAQRWQRHHDLDAAQAIAPAPGGGVWVATTGGLLRWDADGDDYTRHPLQGLPGGPVHTKSLAVTPEGVVWAAIRTGGPPITGDDDETALLRFDGTDWTDHADDQGLPASRVEQLTVGPAGAVWAVTRAEVARFADGAWTRHTPFDDPGADRNYLPVERLVAGPEAMWAVRDTHGRRGGPVARFDGEEWTVWYDDALGSRRQQELAFGAEGRAWLLAGNEPTVPGEPAEPREPDASQPDYRLLRFDGGRWTTVDTWDGSLAGLDHPDVTDLAVGRRGAPWVVLWRRSGPDQATLHTAVARYDDGGWTRWRPGGALPPGHLDGLTVDATGAVWARIHQSGRRSAPPGPGTGRGIVARFADGGWTTHTVDDGLPGPAVAELVTDGGAVWAVSRPGVIRFDGGGSTRFLTDDNPALNPPLAVVAGDGAAWVAGGDGVSRWRDGSWTTWTARDGLAATAATSLAMGADGAVWAGTPAGVSRFADGAWTSWTADDGLPAGTVTSIAVGDGGTVWATIRTHRPTPGEPHPKAILARYDGDEWTTWSDTGPLEEAGVIRLPAGVAAADAGGAWVVLDAFAPSEGPEGSRDTVAAFDDESWQRVAGADGLPEAHVRTVAVEDSGAVWAGTDEGIARFDGTRWATADTDGNPLGLDADDPAAEGSVSHLALGPGGTVWAITDQGLSQFDGEQWRAVDTDRLPIAADGVVSLAADGQRLWFAGPGGLASSDLTRHGGGPR